jgi:hypothetical protein
LGTEIENKDFIRHGCEGKELIIYYSIIDYRQRRSPDFFIKGLFIVFLFSIFTEKIITMKQIAILSIVLLSFASCRQVHGSGNIVKEKKQVESFTGISAGSAFEVEVHIGNAASVEIETDDNLVKIVDVSVDNGVLKIYLKNNYGITDGHLKAFVTVPSLNYIESSGAANVTVLDLLKNPGKIKLNASGAAKIKVEVDAPDVDAESSGAASIELTGRTKEFDADASGAGSIHASGLMSENAKAEASGAGNVHLYASVKLKANASSAGNIFYKGGAAVEQEASSGGSVSKEDN